MSVPATSYIHGTDPAEQARLSRLNDRLNAGTMSVLRLEAGMRVLDVGSGLGQLSRAVGHRVAPSGHVVGIERDDEQRDTAIHLAHHAGEQHLVEFRPGDATDLPLRAHEVGSFDLVMCRFLLEHLSDPMAAVRQMVRAARPGGHVHLSDDDHGLWHMHPACPEWDRTWDAYQRTFEAIGCDPRVGSKLPELLHRAGATPVRAGVVNFGGCNGEAMWDDLIANMTEVVATGRRVAGERGILDGASYDAGLHAAREWADTPGASIWYPVCWAEGVRR